MFMSTTYTKAYASSVPAESACWLCTRVGYRDDRGLRHDGSITTSLFSITDTSFRKEELAKNAF